MKGKCRTTTNGRKKVRKGNERWEEREAGKDKWNREKEVGKKLGENKGRKEGMEQEHWRRKTRKETDREKNKGIEKRLRGTNFGSVRIQNLLSDPELK